MECVETLGPSVFTNRLSKWMKRHPKNIDDYIMKCDCFGYSRLVHSLPAFCTELEDAFEGSERDINGCHFENSSLPTLSIVSSKDLIGFLFPSGNAMISRSYPLKVSVIGVNELGVRKPFSFPPSLNVELWLFFFCFQPT